MEHVIKVKIDINCTQELYELNVELKMILTFGKMAQNVWFYLKLLQDIFTTEGNQAVE
jgi:hypothetical protein